MAEVVTIGEKGQIVIPKKMRENFHLNKGSKLMLSNDEDKIVIKPIVTDEEEFAYLKLSEASLKKTWDNEYDKRWDDVL